MRRTPFIFVLILALAFGLRKGEAAIVVNPAMPIDREVVVQVIQAREDDGTAPANALGDAAQRLSIELALDQIWAQAGIDVTVLPTVIPYNSSFALDKNNNTTGTRPLADFDTIFAQASLAGVLNTGNVINAIFVDYVPGFSMWPPNSAAGLASVPGNRITMYAGDGLFTLSGGLNVVAEVFAHEIGHNLGLIHYLSDAANLMASGGTSEQLTPSQIATARSSGLLRVVPEPGAAVLCALAFGLFAARRRR